MSDYYDDFASLSSIPDREESSDFAVYSALPDAQKRQLCIELLAEFGVSNFNETRKGELQHQCSLPLGGHTDRNSTTASINYRKLVFRCYVCGARGGFLWWIAVNRGESVEQSREWLRSASGITDGLELPKLLELLDNLYHPRVEKRVIPSYDERTLEPWTRWPMQHPYLTGPAHFSEGKNIGCREIPAANLDRLGVGYCDDDPFWKYHQRIIIPMRWDGKLVGWQARRVLPDNHPDDPLPMKYINSPDLPRDRIWFGTEESLSGRELLVVESPMSVLRHLHHLPVAATLGASVSDFQLPLLHRFDRVVLWLDNDPAGWDAIEGTGKGKFHTPGLVETLRDYVEVRVVQSPWWKVDPADHTDEEAEELYRSAKPAVLWKRPDVRRLNWYERKAA